MDDLRPYCRNAAMAGAFMLKDSLGLNTNDRTTWGYVAKTGVDILTRGDYFECIIKEKGSVARVKECPFRHAPVELCMMVCEFNIQKFRVRSFARFRCQIGIDSVSGGFRMSLGHQTEILDHAQRLRKTWEHNNDHRE